MAAPNSSTIRKYLLAIDGSEHARAAVSMLSDLIKNQSEIHQTLVNLLAVFTPLQVSDVPTLHQIVDATQSYFENLGVRVEQEVLLGYPAEKIIETAERTHPRLIAMGAKGLRSAFGIMLGGVAQQIVEYGQWPVIVVRSPYRGLKHILVAIDGSKCSQKALEYLANLNLGSGLEIELLHVLPPAPIQVSPEFYASLWPIDTEYLGPLTTESDAEQEKWAKEEEHAGLQLLNRAEKTLRQAGFKVVFNQKRGDAAEVILEHARNHETDLIIAGSRGLNPIKSWLLGSVSRKLVHYAPCSVLLVRDIACSD